jgi:pantoate kinase
MSRFSPAQAISVFTNDIALKQFVSMAKRYVANKDVTPTVAEYTDIANLYTSNTGFIFTVKDVLDILFFYPKVKVDIVESGMDTLVVGDLLNALGNFILETKWPINGDQVNEKDFFDMLGRALTEYGLEKLTE